MSPYVAGIRRWGDTRGKVRQRYVLCVGYMRNSDPALRSRPARDGTPRYLLSLSLPGGVGADASPLLQPANTKRRTGALETICSASLTAASHTCDTPRYVTGGTRWGWRGTAICRRVLVSTIVTRSSHGVALALALARRDARVGFQSDGWSVYRRQSRAVLEGIDVEENTISSPTCKCYACIHVQAISPWNPERIYTTSPKKPTFQNASTRHT